MKIMKISKSETIRQINVLANILGFEDPESFVDFVIADFYSKNREKVFKFLEEISPLPEGKNGHCGEGEKDAIHAD